MLGAISPMGSRIAFAAYTIFVPPHCDAPHPESSANCVITAFKLSIIGPIFCSAPVRGDQAASASSASNTVCKLCIISPSGSSTALALPNPLAAPPAHSASSLNACTICLICPVNCPNTSSCPWLNPEPRLSISPYPVRRSVPARSLPPNDDTARANAGSPCAAASIAASEIPRKPISNGVGEPGLIHDGGEGRFRIASANFCSQPMAPLTALLIACAAPEIVSNACPNVLATGETSSISLRDSVNLAMKSAMGLINSLSAPSTTSTPALTHSWNLSFAALTTSFIFKMNSLTSLTACTTFAKASLAFSTFFPCSSHTWASGPIAVCSPPISPLISFNALPNSVSWIFEIASRTVSRLATTLGISESKALLRSATADGRSFDRYSHAGCTAAWICFPQVSLLSATYLTASSHHSFSFVATAGNVTCVKESHAAFTAVLMLAPQASLLSSTYLTADAHHAESFSPTAGSTLSVRYFQAFVMAVLIFSPHTGAFIVTQSTAVCHQVSSFSPTAGNTVSVRYFHALSTAALIFSPHSDTFVVTQSTAVCHQVSSFSPTAGSTVSVRYFHTSVMAALICSPHVGAFV